MNRYLKSIDKTDGETAATIREIHAGEFKVVEAALEQILQGLSDFGSQKQKPDNRLESARLFLVTRSFNSIRTAMQMLESGYYQQAETLVRMVMEDQLVAHDIEIHPPTLTALLDGEGKIGRGNLTYGNMAKRISGKAKEAWDNDYGALSRYGAHPRLGSMRALVTEGPDGEVVLRPGGHYDRIWANMVLCYTLRELVLVLETVAKITAFAGIDWVDSATPVFEEVMALWQRIDEWAGKQLAEPDESLESTGGSVD